MTWDDRMKDFRARAGRARALEVIDPAATREAIVAFLAAWESAGTAGKHRLASWPTKF
jgi:hypothetical protein